MSSLLETAQKLGYTGKKDEINHDIDESTWDDCVKAAHDIFILLEKNKIKAKISSTNGVKIKHSNGSVGTLVFDPQNKW